MLLPTYCSLFGCRGRDRTYDQLINSQLLLPLSYSAIFFTIIKCYVPILELGASHPKPMQLYQDPFPAGWTRIVYTSIHDTL